MNMYICTRMYANIFATGTLAPEHVMFFLIRVFEAFSHSPCSCPTRLALGPRLRKPETEF